jgi:hypothetical protein
MTTFLDLIEQMRTTYEAKNHDYGATTDPWANFRLVELLGLTPSQGAMVRMLDKIARIAQFSRSGQLKVKDESVNDTLIDLANYALITSLLLEEERIGKPQVKDSTIIGLKIINEQIQELLYQFVDAADVEVFERVSTIDGVVREMLKLAT